MKDEDLISKLTTSSDDKTNIYDYTLTKHIEQNKDFFGPKEILTLERNHWIMQYRYLVIKYLLNEHIKGDNLNILDLGVGSGSLSKEINKKASYYLGIDKSYECIKYLQETSNLNVDMVEWPNENFTSAVDKFDYIIALNFLEYIEDNARLIFNIKDKLEDDGRAIITIPTNKYIEDTIDQKNNDKILHKYKLKDIELELNQRGLDIEYYTYFQNYTQSSIISFLTKENISKKAAEIKKDNFFKSLTKTISDAIFTDNLSVDYAYDEDLDDMTKILPSNPDILRASLDDLNKIKEKGSLTNGRQLFIVVKHMSNENWKMFLRKQDEKLLKDEDFQEKINTKLGEIFYKNK